MHSLEKKCMCVAANVEIKRRQEANKLQITKTVEFSEASSAT